MKFTVYYSVFFFSFSYSVFFHFTTQFLLLNPKQFTQINQSGSNKSESLTELKITFVIKEEHQELGYYMRL